MKAAEIETFHALYAADEPLTTSQIAKEAFEPEGDDELRNADKKVRYYLTEKYDHLVDVEKTNGALHFELEGESVFFGLGKMDLVTEIDGQRIGLAGAENGGDEATYEEVTLGLGLVMVYEDQEGDFTAVSIRSKPVD